SQLRKCLSPVRREFVGRDLFTAIGNRLSRAALALGQAWLTRQFGNSSQSRLPDLCIKILGFSSQLYPDHASLIRCSRNWLQRIQKESTSLRLARSSASICSNAC